VKQPAPREDGFLRTLQRVDSVLAVAQRVHRLSEERGQRALRDARQRVRCARRDLIGTGQRWRLPLTANHAPFDDDHAAAAERFFGWFGKVLFLSCQVQYRLAHLYGVTFDTVHDGCLQRVDEKIYEGLKGTFGAAVEMARRSSALSGDLLLEVELAIGIRNYVAHRLFIETRSQQGSVEGFNGLAERLDVAFQVLHEVNRHIDEKHSQLFIDAGVTAEVYQAHRKAWDELDDQEIALDVPTPQAWELIETGWIAPGPLGQRILLGGPSGVVWQLVDNGLAHCEDRPTDEWRVYSELQRYLPRKVKARPSATGNPPAYRGSFNYDLRFENGAVLRICKAGRQVLYHEILPPRGGKHGKKERRSSHG
jgi:hypothetical protein